MSATASALATGRLTVSRLAAHKQLPEDFLRGLGVCETGSGVAIPYYGFDGRTVLCTRLRFALAAKDGSRWRKGAGLEAYGLWRIDPYHSGGELLVCEGETNVWTLWHHGYPALGLPGADTARQTLHADALSNVDRLWVVVDPGKSGEVFLRGVTAGLAFCRFAGEVRVVDCRPHKDPSEIHLAGPDAFDDVMRGRMRDAAELPGHLWLGKAQLRHLLVEALRDGSPWLRNLLLDVLAEDVGKLVGELLKQRGGVARG